MGVEQEQTSIGVNCFFSMPMAMEKEMGENIQNLTKHGAVQYVVTSSDWITENRVFISRNSGSIEGFNIEIFEFNLAVENDTPKSLLKAYHDSSSSYQKHEYNGSEEYVVLYASSIAGHVFSDFEVKAVETAVLDWFYDIGTFTALELYDWVITKGNEKEEFPDGVTLSEAYKGTWPCNAIAELSGLVCLLLKAVQWGYEQQKESPDTISLKWCVGDVLSQVEGRDKTLSLDQAREVLAIIEHRHDACIGVNWDVIDCHIDMYLDDLKEAA